MGPTTRSQGKKTDSGVVDTLFHQVSPKDEEGDEPTSLRGSLSKLSVSSLVSVLDDIEDTSMVHGRDAKRLRDATLMAVEEVRQESRGTCSKLAQQVLRAATAGQEDSAQKERILEEFVARLRPNIRYFVKLDNPTSFEQAVNKAQTVEHLLAEAAADKLITPAGQLTGAGVSNNTQTLEDLPGS
ncbi:hypothetical protein Q1695_004333 [Nippostrongylus brasiliensis]|nr:hypothetical protein Q1695_004333 [Nippostrongylus brasiliensis]